MIIRKIQSLIMDGFNTDKLINTINCIVKY